MGRTSTGAQTCEGSKRIELSYLLRNKFLVKGKTIQGILSWTDGHGESRGEISVCCKWTDSEMYVRLNYSIGDRWGGQKEEQDYKIKLTTLPSNLGKGEVLYFVCPVSGKRCRKLYMAYGSLIWKSREAYQHRLYYNGQTSSKYDRPNDRYWVLERRLEKMHREKYLTYSYNGKPTKKALRLERMRERRDYLDSIRWLPENCNISMRKALVGFWG